MVCRGGCGAASPGTRSWRGGRARVAGGRREGCSCSEPRRSTSGSPRSRSAGRSTRASSSRPDYDDSPTRRYPGRLLPARAAGDRRAPIAATRWLERCAVQQAGPAILVLPQGARDAATPIPSTSTGARAATGRRTSRRELAALHRRALPHDPEPVAAARSSASQRAATARRSSGSTTSAVLGDRVVVGLLPPDRSDRDASRSRAARARTHTA